MKTKFSKFLLAMFIALPSLLFSQNYPLQVILTPSSNFTSYFGELKENPGRYMQVRVINNSGASRNVYFQMRIERLYPSTDISVYSNIEKKPDLPIPIAIGSNSMRMDQLDDNFATHQYEDFAVSGIEVNSVDDLMGSFRIPEGQYKLCLIAYDYDTPIGSEPVMLSDPNFSCAQVKICYSASKIELLSPVNTMIAGNSSNVVIQPKRNLLVQWTQPSTTCGASMGNVDYELKFTDIYDGQTEEDALNYNPILLSLSYKNKTSVMLDTMQYQGIFNNGKRYAIGVTATASNQDIAILNDGKTTPASFIYGELPPNKGQQNTVKSKPSITNVPDCGNAVPDNKELIATLNVNDEIQVGDYKLKLSSISKNDDGSFNGEGIINLAGKPLFNGFPEIKAKVKFDKLQVNTANQVIDGIVRTVYDDVEKQKVFGEFGNDPNWASNNLTSDGVDSEVLKSNVKQFIKNFLKPNASQVQANVSFPIKVPTSNNNSDNGINILITSMSFGAKGASVNMLSFMEIPETETMLAFGAKNICTNNNNGNDAKFYLLKDIKTKIEGLDFAIIGGEGKTYVKWDRQGYQGIKLSAKISVPNEVIIRKNGDAINDITINTEFMSWSNWEAKIKIPDFKLAFCHDLSFDELEARYVHKIDATGIFLSNLKMRLPDYIKGLDGIIVESASISSSGFNLSLEKTGILPINSGSIGGWGFSIDELKFNISNNSFTTSKIGGKIRIPFFEKEIAYGGSPMQSSNKMLNLNLSAGIGKNFSTKFLHYFDATIEDNSSITIGSDGKIEAVLNGGVKVDEKSGCDFGFSAEFSGFTIGTNYNDAEHKLDLTIGNWGTSTDSNNSWNGFGFSISNLGLSTKDIDQDKIKLEFSVSANLQLGEGEKPNLSGGCTPIFKFDINKKTKEVSNPSFTLGSVMVAGEFSAVKLYGYLTMFDNDEKWGKGIRGDIDCTFPLKLQVKSKVCFGKTIKNEKNKKYFFADAAFKLPPELGINTGAINIYGFGGAFWWNLEVSGKDFSRDTVSDKNPVSHLKTMGQSEATVATSSGIELVPYTGSGSAFGFAADVYFCSSVGGPYMYNGQVGLGLAFENGNFGSLNLNGKIRVIGDGDEDDSKYVSTGKVGIAITDSSFSASAELNVNVLGVAKAVVPLGLRFDWKNGDFAFELGKPYYRPKGCDSEGDTWCLGSIFDLYIAKVEVTLQGYFCAGTLLNYDMPPLPQRVIDLLGSDNSKVKPRGKAGTKGSAGIMMGTRYSLGFDFNFGPLYAKFGSQLGFDLEIKQSKGQQCADGRKIEGLNGYYCRGQIYGYIHGEVGVKLRFFGITRDFPLCKVEAGALLRGGFPNPTWFKGAVAVKGEILGGLITFNTSARFTVGSECRDSEQVLDVVIIDEISPGFEKMQDAERQKKEEKPSIYNVNTITTHLPMNSPVVLYDLTGKTENNLEYIFRFLDVTLYNITKGDVVIIDKGKFRNQGKSFNVVPLNELDPHCLYKLKVTAIVEQNINGKYEVPEGVDKEAAKETKEVYFAVDSVPNHIHKDVILACNPSNNQYEVFKNLEDTWYITTAMSIDYLFENIDKTLGEKAFLGELYDVRYDPERKYPKRFLYKYHPNGILGIKASNVITFSSMEGWLEKDRVYELRLYVVRKQQEATKYNKIQKEDIIAHEITEGGGDKASLGGSKRDEYRGVDVDKNLGGTKVSEGKHTGKVYEAIRGEQDARTNPLDGILRDGMSKGREIINQGSIANKGSQITNQGNIVGGLSQGSVSGGVGIGNQAMNQGQVTTYSNTGGTTTKSKAMPAIPSVSNMSSNVASNGKVKEPAGTVSTISQIGKNNVGHINPIHITKNIIFKEQVDETKTTYQDYKDVTSNTKLKYIGASNNVNDEVMSAAFVNKVNEYLDDSELEDIYQNAEIHQIYSNYFRVSRFLDPHHKFTEAMVSDYHKVSFDEKIDITSFINGNESNNTKVVRCRNTSMDYVAYDLPYCTTREEAFGGKTINGSRALELPSRILTIPKLFSSRNSKYASFWTQSLYPFLNDLSYLSSEFKLPFVERIRYVPKSIVDMDPCMFIINGKNFTNIEDNFQGPLNDDEINTGIVHRTAPPLSLYFECHQAKFYSMCINYALSLGYQIQKNGLWKQESEAKAHSISIIDPYNKDDALRKGYITINKNDIYHKGIFINKLMENFDIAYYGSPTEFNYDQWGMWRRKYYNSIYDGDSKTNVCYFLPINFFASYLEVKDGCSGSCWNTIGTRCLSEATLSFYPEEHEVEAYYIEPVFGNRIFLNGAKRYFSGTSVYQTKVVAW